MTRRLGEILARRRAGGAKFWFHGLRNCFITVAERELMLPRSLTKRLVNHARPGNVTEGYAADWTVEQLREPAQRIADHIDGLSEPVRARRTIDRFVRLERLRAHVIAYPSFSPWNTP